MIGALYFLGLCSCVAGWKRKIFRGRCSAKSGSLDGKLAAQPFKTLFLVFDLTLFDRSVRTCEARKIRRP